MLKFISWCFSLDQETPAYVNLIAVVLSGILLFLLLAAGAFLLGIGIWLHIPILILLGIYILIIKYRKASGNA